MSRITKAPVSSFSPYYGCAIMAAAVLIFGGIIAWSAYTLLRQNAEIDQFTVPTPAVFPSPALTPEAEAALAGKGASLKKAVETQQPASIHLSIDELNALIARAPDLGNGTYTAIIHVTGTAPEKNALIADINLPLNQLPFSKSPKRYLVGTATFDVEITDEGPDTRITAIDVPGKTVPEGFIESQRVWTWITPFRKDPGLAALLKALRSAKVTADGLTLATE